MKQFYKFVLLFSVLIVSCSTDDDHDHLKGKDGSDGKDGQDDIGIVIKTTSVGSSQQCTNGGVKVEAGMDLNANGILDSDEIQNSTFICTDADPGEILVRTQEEPKGDNCASGGIKILVGLDANGNNELDSEEVSSTSFICHEASKGKAYLYLTGDITDEEAQEIIDTQAGSNTQVLTIENTTQLTKVDLSKLEELIDVEIVDNQALSIVDLSNLKVVLKDIRIDYNSISHLDLGSLSTVESLIIGGNLIEELNLGNLEQGDISIWEPESLSLLNLENFESGEFAVEGNFEQLSLPKYTNSSKGEIYISGENLKEVALPALVKASYIEMDGELLEQVNLENLEEFDRLSFSQDVYPALELGSLTKAGFLELNAGSFNYNDFSNIHSGTFSIIMDDTETLDFGKFAEVSAVDLNIRVTSGNLIDLSRLTEVGALHIEGGEYSSLQTILAPNLKVINGDLRIINHPKLIAADFSSLESVNELFLENTGVQQFGGGSLTSAGVMHVRSNPRLEKLNLSSLSSVDGRFLFTDNPEVSTVDLSSLEKMKDFTVGKNASLTSLELGNLRSAGSVIIENNQELTLVNLKALENADGHFIITFNSKLESVDISALRSVQIYFQIAGNESLSSIAMESFSQLSAEHRDMHFSGNALTTEVVDSILKTLASANPPLKEVQVYLSSQRIPAPPSEEGMKYIEILESNGNTVHVDGKW